MRRITLAVLLAAPLLVGTAGTAAAVDSPWTFGLRCTYVLRMFPHIHQHGPLFNYGPYYGYPPFEPYGNWNAYLHYTGPVPPPTNAGGGAGAYGWIHGGHSAGGHLHPFAGHGGVFHHGSGCAGGNCGGHLHGHKGGCSSCGSTAAAYIHTGNAVDRYNGVGNPAASLAYYADSPAAIITVGYTAR